MLTMENKKVIINPYYEIWYRIVKLTLKRRTLVEY